MFYESITSHLLRNQNITYFIIVIYSSFLYMGFFGIDCSNLVIFNVIKKNLTYILVRIYLKWVWSIKLFFPDLE